MSTESIFDKIPDLDYYESPCPPDPEGFDQIINSRRSVRVYEKGSIPEDDMKRALHWALLAPNSSNLQCWRFYWVRDEEKKKQLVDYCFAQPAARTASELVVAVAVPRLWKKHSRLMLEEFSRREEHGETVPKAAKDYYRKIVPFMYTLGPFGVFGLFKRLLFCLLGIFRVVPRQPLNYEQLKKWAVKSSALACQNFMLGMTALGYDSCPLEGFDEKRVKKLLGLYRKDEVTMVISCGRRSSQGVYGPRVRFSSGHFLKTL